MSQLQESKLYGAHFREIAADAPKSKKITFDDSDEDWMLLSQDNSFQDYRF